MFLCKKKIRFFHFSCLPFVCKRACGMYQLYIPAFENAFDSINKSVKIKHNIFIVITVHDLYRVELELLTNKQC